MPPGHRADFPRCMPPMPTMAGRERPRRTLYVAAKMRGEATAGRTQRIPPESCDRRKVRGLRTRERILDTSLELFNRFGAPGVTTHRIADEMEISPGNLYYHYRNKEDIVYALFLRFEQRIGACLGVSADRSLTVEDMWLYLHLVFESIVTYRFLYRDLENLLGRQRRLRLGFRRIVLRKIATARSICQGLRRAGVLVATDEQIDALANNIGLATTYSINYQNLLLRTAETVGFSTLIGRAVYQVMALVSPFLAGEARELYEHLGRDYLRVR